jgi:hypothetical protein
MNGEKSEFDKIWEEQHKAKETAAADTEISEGASAESIVGDASKEQAGAAEIPAGIDFGVLSKSLGREVKDIEELKGVYTYKDKVAMLEQELSEYERVASEEFDVTKHVSLDTLKAESITTKIPISFDKARALAKGQPLSDIDYLMLGSKMNFPSLTLGEADLKAAILEEYGIEEDDLSDMKQLSPLKQMNIERAISSAKKQVDGVLSEAGNVSTSSFGDLLGKRKAGKIDLEAKIEEEYKPFAEKVVGDFKSIKFPTEEGGEFEFKLPEEFSEGMQEMIVSNAKLNGKLLTKETAENIYSQLHAIAWSSYGTKIAEAYGKHMYSEAMKASDIKYANPAAGTRSIENADAGASGEQREVHQFAKRPESQFTKKTS